MADKAKDMPRWKALVERVKKEKKTDRSTKDGKKKSDI